MEAINSRNELDSLPFDDHGIITMAVNKPVNSQLQTIVIAKSTVTNNHRNQTKPNQTKPNQTQTKIMQITQHNTTLSGWWGESLFNSYQYHDYVLIANTHLSFTLLHF